MPSHSAFNRRQPPGQRPSLFHRGASKLLPPRFEVAFAQGKRFTGVIAQAEGPRNAGFDDAQGEEGVSDAAVAPVEEGVSGSGGGQRDENISIVQITVV